MTTLAFFVAQPMKTGRRRSSVCQPSVVTSESRKSQTLNRSLLIGEGSSRFRIEAQPVQRVVAWSVGKWNAHGPPHFSGV